MPVISVTYTVKDAKGKESTVTMYSTDDQLPSIGTIPNLVLSLGNIVRSLITGQIVGASLCFNVDEVVSQITANGSPAANSDVEQKGVFLYDVAGGFKGFKISLPTIDESFLLPTSTGDVQEIDMTDPSVLVFINQLEGGIVTEDELSNPVTVAMSDYRGTDLNNVYEAYESFTATKRKRR